MTTVFLHIGTMKAGTTFIQNALREHRAGLEELGVLFPGDPGYRQQVAAVRDLLALPGPVPAAELDGAWDRLAAQVAAWEGGRAVVSVEHLSLARKGQIRRLLASLAPADVQVVLTVRDLGRVMPSTWQENVQNGLTWTWPEFCASVSGADGAPAQAGDRFWKQHDVMAIVERWLPLVGADRLQVVTVPPAGAGADLLWQRFCGVLGLDAAALPVDLARDERNAGIDLGSAELLRRLNVALAGRLDRQAYTRHVKQTLAKRVLGRRTPTDPIVMDPATGAWAARRADEVVAALTRSGVRVVGDLDELRPVPADTTETASAGELDAAVAAAATAAAAGAVRELAQRSAQRQKGQREKGREKGREHGQPGRGRPRDAR